jgi:transcriptional antiterminator RfaH
LTSLVNGSNDSGLWYLLRSRPKMECFAATLLKERFGLNVFLPQGRVASHSQELRYVPFFPGYLFVQIDLERVPLSYISTCPGVLNLITFDGMLESIPHPVIEMIQSKVNDFNREERFLNCSFHPGDTVRFKEGALQELDMVLLGFNTPDNRARALITILGRMKEISVDLHLLEGAPNSLSQKRVRYTRGKGRKITHKETLAQSVSGIDQMH